MRVTFMTSSSREDNKCNRKSNSTMVLIDSKGESTECYILCAFYESDAPHRCPRVFGDVRSLVRPRNSGPRGGSGLAARRKYGYFHSLLAASLEALGPCAAGQLSGWQQDHSVRRPRDVKEIAHR